MSTYLPSFDALKPLAGRALEIALMRVLALDPETRIALEALDGKCFEFVLEAPPLALMVTVQGGDLKVGPVSRDIEADLGLRATVGGLLSQLPFIRPAQSTPVGKLRINGDAELARILQRLAERFDPDWQAPFIQIFGPIIGPQVAGIMRQALRVSWHSVDKLARDTAEYLTEESRDLVAKAELEAFYDDVDVLRDRAERLLARASRLSIAPCPSKSVEGH